MRWYSIMLACVASLVIAGCGGGGGTTESSSTADAERPAPTGTAKEFDVTIKDGGPDGGPGTIKVTQDTRVKITVRSNERVRAHLHGYDILETATKGSPAVFDFMADTAGVFELEDEDSAELLANVAVYPPK